MCRNYYGFLKGLMDVRILSVQSKNKLDPTISHLMQTHLPIGTENKEKTDVSKETIKQNTQ